MIAKISIFNHPLFVLTTRHERMQNGTNGVSISLIGLVHFSKLDSHFRRPFLPSQKYFAWYEQIFKSLCKIFFFLKWACKTANTKYYLERKWWKFLKWFLWVEMVWCYHLGAAHVPSSPFCLFNSSSSLRAWEYFFKYTLKINVLNTLLKKHFQKCTSYVLSSFFCLSAASAAAWELESISLITLFQNILSKNTLTK